MIAITGDTHGEVLRFFTLPVRLGRGDTLIVAGDFGCLFDPQGRDEAKLEQLSTLPYTILFLDGNHECFPRIYSCPEETFCGGRVHRVRDNILHLMRGQVYDMEGISFFTMGGGYSIDKMYRIPGRSWWPEEMPNQEEYALGRRMLARRGGRVDFIISHAAPASVMAHLVKSGVFQTSFPQEAPLHAYLQEVEEHTRYKRHYFGHLHMDGGMPGGQVALYRDCYDLLTGERLGGKGENGAS